MKGSEERSNVMFFSISKQAAMSTNCDKIKANSTVNEHGTPGKWLLSMNCLDEG